MSTYVLIYNIKPNIINIYYAKKKVQKPMTALESLRGNRAVRPAFFIFHYGDMILREDRRMATRTTRTKLIN